MQKIGLDLRLFGIQHGGIGRYCQELFPLILELDKANEYFIFVNKHSASLERILPVHRYNNISIVQTNARHYSLAEQTGFLRLLNKYNLDLAHFPNFNVPLFYKKPFVVTIHDMVHHKIGGAKISHFLHFLAYKKVMGAAAKNSKQIMTVSEASKKDIASLLDVDEKKIKVIYEGASLDPDVDKEGVDEIKNRYLLKRPYFLFVGVLERKKNIINLSRGFDYFLRKFKLDMDLVIAGKDDTHYPEIKRKAMGIKNSGRLVFTGEIEDIELASLYKGAYAFVSASLHEGFGLPGVEAMGFGLPLLVSNIDVFNEIYDDAGIYFNPLLPEDIAQKMNILTRDRQFYEELSSHALKRSKIFSWDKAAKETLAIYNQILSS